MNHFIFLSDDENLNTSNGLGTINHKLKTASCQTVSWSDSLIYFNKIKLYKKMLSSDEKKNLKDCLTVYII
jgi:hypothetical protein